MLVTPPFGASSNIALWRAYSKPPVELVVADLDEIIIAEYAKNEYWLVGRKRFACSLFPEDRLLFLYPSLNKLRTIKWQTIQKRGNKR